MLKAAGLVGLAALACAGSAHGQTQQPDPDVSDLAVATLNVGDVLDPADRASMKLAPKRRYAGLYSQTMEGAFFRNGTKPDVPFRTGDGNCHVMLIDRKSRGFGLIPDRPANVSVDTIFVEFWGEEAIARPGDPAVWNGCRIVWLDQVVSARRVPDSQVLRIDPN